MAKIKNPFRLEEQRTLLAKANKVKDFKATYTSSLPQINDTNTPEFWDKENTVMETMEFGQNPMAVDRARFVANSLGEKRQTTLDVGLGSGISESVYQDIFPKSKMKIYGIDFSPKSVLRAKKRFKNGEFKRGSILKIPYKDQAFENVICLEVMEHIVPAKTFQALSELYRVMKRNGKLILSVPLNEGLEEMVKQKRNPNHHVRVYSPEMIKVELEIAGFTIVKEKFLYAYGKYYYLKSFLAKYLKKPANNIVLIARRP